MPEMLTKHQELVLKRLTELEVPSAPVIEPAALQEPPFWYRWAPITVPMGIGLFLFLILVPFLKVPEVWNGITPLASGSVLQLDAQTSQEILLPDGKGTIVLQGPGVLQLDRLSRHPISGRLEGTLTLKEGSLLIDASAEVPKRLWILTPLLQVRITGTQLLIGHRPDQGSRLVFWEGKVQVRPSGGRWQPLASGSMLAITPEGQVEQKGLSASDFRWPMESSRLPSSISNLQSEVTDFNRLLWYEED